MNETHKSSMPEVTDIEVPPMLEVDGTLYCIMAHFRKTSNI